MKNKEITYNQLVIGLLSKFGSIDEHDILIAMSMIKANNFSEVNQLNIEKYICRDENNRITFNMDVIRSNYQDIDQFYLMINKNCGDTVRKYLDNLDLFEFILRKIKLLNTVNLNSYNDNFSEFQLYIINELKSRGYLTISSPTLISSDNESYLKLSKRGTLYLYMIDNKPLIDRFLHELRINGYDERLIEVFLIIHDLEKDTDDIFTIDKFLEFCSNYNICPTCNSKEVYTRKRVQQ